MRVLYGLGRAAFGGFFLYNGIHNLKNMPALQDYAAAKRMHYPHHSVKGTGLLLTAAGASLVFGLKPKLGAAATVCFLAGASVIFHDFWNQEDPATRQAELIQFSKNMALMGGAIAIAGSEES
jgi:uncharacterized membrane protein YphA (DoxX/SURF4 family)